MKTGKGDRKGGARPGPDQPWHPGDGAEREGGGERGPRRLPPAESVCPVRPAPTGACPPCVSLCVPACPSHTQPRDCGASPLPWAGASWSRSPEAARRDGPGVQALLPDRRGRRSPRSGASLAGGGGSLGPARAVTALPLAVPTGSAISCPELRKAWPGSPWRLRKRVPPGAASCSFSVGDSGSGRPASWDCALAWARGRASALTGACVQRAAHCVLGSKISEGRRFRRASSVCRLDQRLCSVFPRLLLTFVNTVAVHPSLPAVRSH